MAPGANTTIFRRVVTPLEAAAVTETEHPIPGGAPFDLGPLQLPSAVAASGTVSADGEPIAAHLLVSRGLASPIEVFATIGAGFSAELPAGNLNVDVLPADPTLAPMRINSVLATGLEAITLTDADEVSGSVRGPAGTPLSGTRVLLVANGLPSALATSSGAGAFTVSSRALGGPQELTVVAGARGLPDLVGQLDALSASDTISIDYNPIASATARNFAVTETNGQTAVANARVTFISEPITAAGAVRINGGEPIALDGRVRATALADAAGVVSNILLADGAYRIVVARPGESPGLPAIISRTVVGGVDTNLSMPAPGQWTATLHGSSGQPLAGARCTFKPRGDIATVGGASISAVADSAGLVSVDLVGGASYELQIDSDAGRFHAGAITVAAPGESMDVGVIAAPAGQVLTGTIKLASGAVAKAHVAFYCTDCASPEVPLAEAVTDSAGAYEILVPDSGIE